MSAWGRSTITGSTTGINGCIGHAGLFNPGSNGTLDSVELYFDTATDLTMVRAAVYQGGLSDIDASGATLLEDLGVGSGSVAGWHVFTSISNPTLTDNTRTWIVYRGDNGTGVGLVVYSTSSADAGDFYTTGRVTLTGQTGLSDETIAFPATMDNTGASAGSYWYAIRLNYTLVSTANPLIRRARMAGNFQQLSANV